MPIILITGYGDVPVTVQLMKARTVEFLTKPFDDEVLLCAIRSAVEPSGAALCHEVGIRTPRNLYASLTPCERQVMALLASGPLNKPVAGELGICGDHCEGTPRRGHPEKTAGSLADL
jgi:FixJ family two-component response regulator